MLILNCLARMMGLEPTISYVTGRRLDQLDYIRINLAKAWGVEPNSADLESALQPLRVKEHANINLLQNTLNTFRRY